MMPFRHASLLIQWLWMDECGLQARELGWRFKLDRLYVKP